MTDIEDQIQQYNDLCRVKELEYIARCREVREFCEKPRHKAKTIKQAIAVSLEMDKEIDELLEGILNNEELVSFNRSEVNSLCKKFKELRSYPEAMKNDLRRIQDKSSSDFARDTGIYIGIIAAFIAAQKAGVGTDTIDINQAALLGGIVGFVVVSHKEIRNLFGVAKTGICNRARSLKNKIPLKTSDFKHAFNELASIIHRKILAVKKTENKKTPSRMLEMKP